MELVDNAYKFENDKPVNYYNSTESKLAAPHWKSRYVRALISEWLPRKAAICYTNKIVLVNILLFSISKQALLQLNYFLVIVNYYEKIQNRLSEWFKLAISTLQAHQHPTKHLAAFVN